MRSSFRKAAGSGNLHIEAHLSKDSVSIAKMLLNLGKFQLNAAGTITNFRQPKLDVVVETNAFDIQSLLAHAPIAKASLPPELTLSVGARDCPGWTLLRISPFPGKSI